MAFLTDYAVRRKGETMAIRYCVPCLKEDSRVQATHISDGAGYCFPCAREMKAQGHVVYTVSEWARKELQESRGRKLGARKYVRVTPEMRRQIIAHPEVAATKMAAKFGISAQTVHNVWAASNEAMEEAVKDLDVPRSNEQALAAAVAEQGPEAVEEAVEVPVNEAPPEFDEETPVFSLEREVPIEEIRNMYPGRTIQVDEEALLAYKEELYGRKVCAAPEPEPVSRNKEALRRVMEEGTEPVTVPITLNLTHEKCDSILLALTLAEKAEIVRAELLKRLEAL